LRAGARESDRPYGDTLGLSWGFTALRGLGPGSLRAVIGSARPVRRFHAPRGFGCRAVLATEVARRPPLRFCAPSEVHSRQPRIAPSHPPAAAGGSTWRTVLPLLGFPALRHVSNRWLRIDSMRLPAASACHVRGLATPFAAPTIGPTGARGAGASMGFSLQGFPLDAVGTPLGAPALVTLPSPPPRGESAHEPPSGPRTRVESVLSPQVPKDCGRRCLPGVLPSRAFSPSARAVRL